MLLYNGESQNRETAAKGPNGLPGEKFGQGLPTVQYFRKKFGKNGRDRLGKVKKIAEKRLFLTEFSSDFRENWYTDSSHGGEQ